MDRSEGVYEAPEFESNTEFGLPVRVVRDERAVRVAAVLASLLVEDGRETSLEDRVEAMKMRFADRGVGVQYERAVEMVVFADNLPGVFRRLARTTRLERRAARRLPPRPRSRLPVRSRSRRVVSCRARRGSRAGPRSEPDPSPFDVAGCRPFGGFPSGRFGRLRDRARLRAAALAELCALCRRRVFYVRRTW